MDLYYRKIESKIFFGWIKTKKANSGLNGIYEYNDQRIKELNDGEDGTLIPTYESGEYIFFMIIAFILFVATLFTVKLVLRVCEC